jgi:SWIM zinc finger
VLPFDLSMMEDLNPRLVSARELVANGAVTVIRSEPFEATVKSGDVSHRVREVEESLHCTCPWFGKHQGERGPCKHVLAAGSLRS